ncbi:MAG TPA: DUF308 domain-containing protein [Anaerolineae bacterium]|nr:DUF308 domain-containing protein [Anaerolineae bacterium]
MATYPQASVQPMKESRAEQFSRNWWIVLVSGILSVIAGTLILSIPWTLSSLSIFIGAFLILRGIAQALSPPHTGSTRSWNIGMGILTALVGIGIIAFPAFAGFTLLTLALFVGILLIAWGTTTIVSSVSNRATASYWWLSTLAGSLAVILGFFALFRPALTLAVAITVVGVWAIVIGITEIALSFEVRRLPETIRRMELAPTTTAAEIEQMALLRDRGIISEEEFAEFKKKKVA